MSMLCPCYHARLCRAAAVPRSPPPARPPPPCGSPSHHPSPPGRTAAQPGPARRCIAPAWAATCGAARLTSKGGANAIPQLLGAATLVSGAPRVPARAAEGVSLRCVRWDSRALTSGAAHRHGEAELSEKCGAPSGPSAVRSVAVTCGRMRAGEEREGGRPHAQPATSATPPRLRGGNDSRRLSERCASRGWCSVRPASASPSLRAMCSRSSEVDSRWKELRCGPSGRGE